MRVLVSGGAGFIGSHIAEGALAAGHEVSVLDNLSTGKRENVPAAARLYAVDVRDREAVNRALADFRPDVVSHQAAQASVSASMREPRVDVEINVLGGIHLLDACVACGVKRLVFASTGGAIYGEVAEGSFAGEDTRPNPISPYAISKLAFEHLLGVYQRQHGLEARILRYANVYGPRQDPHGEAGVVAIFFNRTLAGQGLSINARRTPGDPGCVRDYVYVSDVARANLAALANELSDSVLNVGTGAATSTLELAKLVSSLARVESGLAFGPPRAGDIERSVLDASRFERALGKPVAIADGLRKTYDWYRASL